MFNKGEEFFDDCDWEYVPEFTTEPAFSRAMAENKNSFLSLPHDIQGVVWKMFFVNHVLLEMRQRDNISFLRDSSNTRNWNDMIMIRSSL